MQRNKNFTSKAIDAFHKKQITKICQTHIKHSLVTQGSEEKQNIFETLQPSKSSIVHMLSHILLKYYYQLNKYCRITYNFMIWFLLYGISEGNIAHFPPIILILQPWPSLLSASIMYTVPDKPSIKNKPGWRSVWSFLNNQIRSNILWIAGLYVRFVGPHVTPLKGIIRACFYVGEKGVKWWIA